MYQILDIKIPQDKKREINQKVLHIVDSGKQHPQITPDVIFNTYSPLGSIHGLEFKNYDNFHQFQEAKKDVTFGQYFTPLNISKWMCLMLKIPREWKVADLTAGTGSLINFLQNPDENIFCNEWETKSYKILKYLFPDINHSNKDIREYTTSELMDCIVGNPPFSLTWQYNKNTYNSEVFYLLRAFEMLKPAGLCAVIVPESFLVDDFKDKGNINLINKHFNFVSQFILPTNIFESVGAKITTKIMLFQKKSEHIKETPYINGQHMRIELESLDHKTATYYYNEYIKPLYEQKESVKGKLLLEAIQQGSEKDNNFEYKVKKMLFDIKRGKNTKKHYNRAEAYILKFKTQEKPNDMKYEEYAKIRITEAKVLSYLKRILKEQHKAPEKHITRLTKYRYSLKLKAYSTKERKLLKAYTGVKEMSWNDMVLQDIYPFDDKRYYKLFLKKKREYERQNKPFSEIQYNNKVNSFLDHFSLYNKEKQKEIKLFAMQKEALNKLLQKRYSMLNFQQGLGKTETAITWYKYLKQFNKVRNVFIISSSLSVNLTWVERLTNYSESFIKIDSLEDIRQIKNGDTVLITFNMVTKYQKQLKKYIKQQSQKVALIVDESHRLSNEKSLRTRSTLNVFRRVKYKLLATGTPTRNNLNEIYPQMIELAYNNSINALNECKYIYKEDKITKELKEEVNENYLKPFPANKLSKFKECFSPSKKSIFGIDKDNQNIYNSESLKNLVEKFIITKKFKEIAGDKYEVKTHRITQNENEKEVYRKIMEEFYTMIPNYFSSTGNSRKDSMLRIIRQLQLMIMATSIPHTMKEYNGTAEPNKYKYIENLINDHNEKVIVGTVFIKSCDYYFNKLKAKFPNRKIFIIQGNVPFKKRKIIIDEFEKTSNGIIITTQSSLSESVNIPSCNMVICEALPWNCSNLEQFYFRTIRIDSESNTTVYLISYKNTIQENILALLMSKERVNEYLKTLEYKENAEIFSDYGIDLDVFNSLISKNYDSEGHMTLSWGEQKVI